MTEKKCSIYLVDDDPSIRRSISLLLNSAGYSVSVFDDGENLLASENYSGKGCIILDIYLHGESSLVLHQQISQKFCTLPIIYLTGHGNVPMSVEAFKNGAINFLQKPIDEKKLFSAIEEALESSEQMVHDHAASTRIRNLLNTLTPRETEGFLLLTKGYLNKQIAMELHIAEHTVKIHRGKITGKLGVKSVAEMVVMASIKITV